MDPIFGFPITLPPPGSRELLRVLHKELRGAILDGRLKPGLRLPATRELAGMLAISRNTVVAAYDLLLSEGYVVARRGAGNYVADTLARRDAPRLSDAGVDMDRRLAPHWRKSPGPFSAAPDRVFRHDFSLGVPDNTQFPFDVWRRLSARALRTLSKAPPAYGQPEGRPALREAIAKHISFARAVACHADDVIVTSGAQQAFDLLARVLVTPGRSTVAVEDPGYPPLHAAFAAAGANVVAVPVDDEGLVVERLPVSARVIYVTPSHQFPLGVALSPQRRAALLEFARVRRAVVIEDDYDGEFRYSGRPLDALQTLDRSGSVCYVGTFSKCLFPALRLGYVVAPPWLRPALAVAKQLADWHCDVLAQDTLAAFIAEGHLVRHVRKMHKVYAERREVLLDALVRHSDGRLLALPSEAGLHLSARIPRSSNARMLVARAAAEGIRLDAVGRYALGRSAPNGLAFGFGMIAADRVDEAVRRVVMLMGG
ncbi:MAG TPA: PLP-dependent aminotransferase family protein [Rhodanobacter sp.]|jgi:GntR family transcriptional regulator/MocR family aminotransferase|nr:PLP-dependent aminotransferase family protein [Rhodanobacter sp.]